MDLVLDTENATVTATDTVMFYVPAGAQVRVDDVGVEDASHTTTSTLGYNAANELTSMTDGSATIYFTYDPWGRMVSKYQAQTYTASYAYRYGTALHTVASNFPQEGNVTYEYGGNGKRRSRTAGANQTWYNCDSGWNVLSEEDNAAGTGNLVISYVMKHPEAEVPQLLGDATGNDPLNAVWRYHYLDHLGSTRRLHAQDKSTLATHQFGAYGEAYFHTGTASTPFFTGKPWDSISQLYFFPYRHFSPEIGRWLTRDPIVPVSRYSYVTRDPVNRTDPLGLFDIPTFQGGNPWQHCHNSCVLAKYVGWVKAWWLAQIIYEQTQVVVCLSTGNEEYCASAEQQSDYADNRIGLGCALRCPWKSCAQCCREHQIYPGTVEGDRTPRPYGPWYGFRTGGPLRWMAPSMLPQRRALLVAATAVFIQGIVSRML